MPRINFTQCDGIRLKNFIMAGSRWLSYHKEYLDEINYFPVPDADTGSNMYLTFTSICSEIRKQENPYSASAIAKAAAMGGLIGGKGNSGLILAQFFRGFSEYIADREILNSEDIAHAFKHAAITAREGIVDPRDGTILSVAADAADAAIELSKKSKEIMDVIKAFYKESLISLEKTRSILPELSKVGEVDSGAQGLVLFFEGMLRLAQALSIKEEHVTLVAKKGNKETDIKTLKYQFCTSFIIKKYPDTIDDDIKSAILEFGDSIIVDKGIDNVVKIHIHTNQPDNVLECVSKLGVVDNIDIEDMKKQVVDR